MEVNDIEKITVRITPHLLSDKLYMLAAEYSVSAELLINIAVKRLLDDVDFIRDLRAGKIEME